MLAAAATAASTSPVSGRRDRRGADASPTCPAAAARRKQALSADVDARQRIDDRARQRGMCIALADRVERRECAGRENRRLTASARVRARSGRARRRRTRSPHRTGQASRAARFKTPIRVRATRASSERPDVSRMPGTWRARPSSGAALAPRHASVAAASISRAGGGQSGQAGGRHGFTAVEREPDRIADRDVPIADRGCSPGLQVELATGDVCRQRERTAADVRPADADEAVAGAQIETAREHGFDPCLRDAGAELLRQHPGAQDRDHGQPIAPRRHAAAGRAPSAAIAASAASALESATITPASASVRTCAVARLRVGIGAGDRRHDQRAALASRQERREMARRVGDGRHSRARYRAG